MKRETSCLCVIDIQEKLIKTIHQHEALLDRCRFVMTVAKRLGVAMLVSEQYPKGLGHTVAELGGFYTDADVADKVVFSCQGDDGWAARFAAMGRQQAILIGMEAHVCVLQTALDLKAKGVDVFVVADAVSSRAPVDRDLALARMRDVGINVVSAEMVFFEWLGQAGTAEFKELSELIK